MRAFLCVWKRVVNKNENFFMSVVLAARARARLNVNRIYLCQMEYHGAHHHVRSIQNETTKKTTGSGPIAFRGVCEPLALRSENVNIMALARAWTRV